MNPKIRLNKFLARQLGISRREADEFIAKGRVKLGNTPAELGAQVQPETDLIYVDEKKVATSATDKIYLKLHKPAGYVCSRKRQGEAPTIYELITQKFHHLNPVGRLDKNSSGILLLTNDGDFAHTMTHPSFEKEKIYLAKLNKELSPGQLTQINQKGVELPDGLSKFKVEKKSEKTYKIIMHEGRNRQIRRTFEALQCKVTSLHRIKFGQYEIGDLSPGSWQEIN